MEKPIFYSQLGEDLYIFKNFINKIVKDGIFIELGALDGITTIFRKTILFQI